MPMAAYAYSAWASQSTPTAQLTMLNLHIGEVSALMNGADVSADGKSISRSTLQQYLNSLYTRADKLASDGAGVTNGGVMLARFREAT
jgi:hypothetical protein